MTGPAGIRAVFGVRAVRHGAAATTLVVTACAVLAGLSWLSFRAADGELRPLTARAFGTVTAVEQAGAARIEWDGRSARVDLAGPLPKPGTRTEIAFDPAEPGHAVIPGAAVLSRMDQAAGGVTFSALVALAVLAAGSWRMFRGMLAARRPAREIEVRRIRVQSGLTSRSWLETANDEWFPVYFEPALITLPAPSVLRVFGDPGRNRWLAAEIPDADADAGAGVRLYPSGPVRRREPRGRRIDNPVRPDAAAVERAAATGRRRQLRADAVLLVPAPLIGALWAYLDGGGFPGWLAATVIAAVVGLWLASYRGSDPT